MKVAEFAHRLDTLFRVRDYPEPNGWAFALSPSGKASLLRRASATFRETFNGLIGNSAQELHRVYLLVFPERSLIARVIESEQIRGTPGAVIVTHHPLDMETSGRGFVEIPDGQLDALNAANIALYVLHAPLDCHPGISTSGAMSDGLGLRRAQTFAAYCGGDCGVIGVQEPESFASFAGRVRLLCELPWFGADQVRFSGREVSKIGIVAGGGDDAAYIEDAESLGCDTFLAGHWRTPHRGDWCDQNRRLLSETIASSRMNFLSASHDGSELVVFRDQLEPLFRSWGIDVVLLRQADHWR